ncbi:hypothetical protein QFC22_006683 [Naganishia vaughanmartiniae]|uniref:Uncharacterized protein n=1 Tax=Naganishia vaughanmartiniae TaxID=1424756 RepID=A0ACC2WHC7_9TREE|nr:hypothetical protein QFC22_006683 [Naganishia vaughanmartiniae]
MLCGLLAFLFWSVPGAAGMAGLAAAVRSFPDKLPPIVLALLTGLNASAVGLIALAAYQLSLTAISDGVGRLVLVTSASLGICYHAPWVSSKPGETRLGVEQPCFPNGEEVKLENGKALTLNDTASEGIEMSVLPTLDAMQEDQSNDGLQPLPHMVPVPPIARTRSTISTTSFRPDTFSSGKDDVGSVAPPPLDGKRDDDGSSAVDRYPPPPLSGTTLPEQQQQQQGLRYRHTASHTNTHNDIRPPSVEGETPASDERLRTTLMVPSKRWAYSLGASFVVCIITLVVLRAKYPRSEGDAAPRALDFFVNMVLAGVIIFGGGPVVVPLLRGYTVENGKCAKYKV